MATKGSERLELPFHTWMGMRCLPHTKVAENPWLEAIIKKYPHRFAEDTRAMVWWFIEPKRRK